MIWTGTESLLDTTVTYFVLSKFKDSIALVHSSTLVILTVLLGDRILLVRGSLLGVWKQTYKKGLHPHSQYEYNIIYREKKN